MNNEEELTAELSALRIRVQELLECIDHRDEDTEE